MNMEQTNRTILFEMVNPEKINLLTMVNESGERQSLTDEEILEIHEKLAVSSFEEFIKKFDPSINMILDTANLTVKFSNYTMGSESECIRLDTKDSLFNMLLYIMEAKKKRKYVLTGFKDLLESIIPKDTADQFLDERNLILTGLSKTEQRDSSYIRKKICSLYKKYDDGIFLINCYLQDTYKMLMAMDQGMLADKGILHDEEYMQTHLYKKADKYRFALAGDSSINTEEYDNRIRQYSEDIGFENAIKNKELLIDCMMLPVHFAAKQFETIQKKYDAYLKLYIEIIKKFWQEAKPVMQTMLGVKEYFAQYADLQEGMRPTLVISNFQLSDLLLKKNTEKLEVYLNSVNTKSFYKQTIWYAIIPNMVSVEDEKKQNIRKRFMTRDNQYTYERKQAEEISLLLNLLAKYRILSFLSLSLTEENTFSNFRRKGMQALERSLICLEKIDDQDYLVPCFPNFIVVPEEQACLLVGKELVFDELIGLVKIKSDKTIWLDEIGIEASYIAAGLVAACQCPQYLKQYFKRGIDDTLPGVAYRLTENDHNLHTISNMLSETIEFPEELIEEIQQRSRGIIFIQKKGKMIVLTDRVFSYNRSNQLMVSMIQTMNYIERLIQSETQDFKKNLISEFFQQRPGSVISKWNNKDKNIINAILKENEELTYQINEDNRVCTFSIHFSNADLVRNNKVTILKE